MHEQIKNELLEKTAFEAVMDVIAKYTVLIDGALAVGDYCWGTGTFIEYKGKKFVLTCRHLFSKRHSNEDLRFLSNPKGKIEWGEKDIIKSSSLRSLEKRFIKSFCKKLPVVNRLYSDVLDDLLLLELDGGLLDNEINFFSLDQSTVLVPKEDRLHYFLGFSRELVRDSGRGLGVFPLASQGIISDKKFENEKLDFKRHFLIDYPKDDRFVDPVGLSGCGIWTREPSGRGVWTSNLRLVGVQSSFFEKKEVLKATRIERAFELYK